MKKCSILAGLLAVLLLFCGCAVKETPAPQPAAPAVTEAPAAEAAPEAAPEAQPEAAPETAEEAVLALPDGVYTAEFNTDSGMFHANEACDGKGTLTVENGKAVFHVSLVSKSILNLYPGTAEDAKNDTDNWLQPTSDTVTYSDGYTDTVYGFDIPVSVVNKEFNLALIGKKGVWYDHKVSIDNPVLQVANGSYTCEVTLAGGSGRSYIESPAMLTVEDGVITATIRWSSSTYDFMQVDGVQYDPVSGEEQSVFVIPVVLNTDLAVSADTIAMSEPHLIDYILHFDGATLVEVTE